MITTVAATLTLFDWESLGNASRTFLVPALVLQWAGVVTTIALYVPQQTKLRTAQSPPPDYARIVKQAVAANAARTAMFIAAWTLLVVSIVLD